MKAFVKTLRRAIVRKLQPYTVHVLGGTFDGVVHRAFTYADALDWARCYSVTQCLEVHIRTRSGAFAGRVI